MRCARSAQYCSRAHREAASRRPCRVGALHRQPVVEVLVDEQVDANSSGAYVHGGAGSPAGCLGSSQAVLEGWWLVIDNVDAAPPDLALTLARCSSRADLLPGSGEVMHAHENFRVFVTRAAEAASPCAAGKRSAACARGTRAPDGEGGHRGGLGEFWPHTRRCADAVLRASERLQGEGQRRPRVLLARGHEVVRANRRPRTRPLFVGERTVLKGVPEAERWLCVAEGFDVLIAGDRKQEGASGWQCLAAAFELLTHGGAKKEGVRVGAGGGRHVVVGRATMIRVGESQREEEGRRAAAAAAAAATATTQRRGTRRPIWRPLARRPPSRSRARSCCRISRACRRRSARWSACAA